MAATYNPGQAFDFCKRYIKNMNLYTIEVQARILNDALSMLWMAAPWRWTLGNFASPITLVAATQDYTVVVPADFLYLEDAYLADGQIAPRHFRVEPFLPTTVIQQGIPDKISLIQGTTTLRVYPKPGTQPASAPQIVTTYKKQAPVVTLANLYTTGLQIFDDEWFWVYIEGVLWRAYQYGDDQRVGNVTYTPDGKFQMTGQRAAFEASLELMRQREKLPNWEYKNPPEVSTTK